MEVGELDFNEMGGTVIGPAGTVRLTQRESSLLACLARRSGGAVTREELLGEAWGWDNARCLRTKTVDVHIGRLRRKLGEAGFDPGVVETVWGEGYRLRDDVHT